jgi:class 3 adenylate cyclase
MDTTRFVRTRDGVNIAFHEVGAGAPLVFSRGWITHLDLFWAQPSVRAFFAPLERHLRVVRFDARGNGLSDRRLAEPIDLDGLVADIEAVVDAVDLARFSLWGSAFGGPPAVAFTHRHPERVERLILDGTYANGARVTTPERRDALLAMLAAATEHPDAVHVSLSYLTDPAPAESHADRIRRARRSIDQDVLDQLYRLVYEIDVSALLADLKVPTLVIHRQGSRMFPLDCGRELAAAIPGSQFVALPGRANNLWDDRPEDGLRAVAEFLAVPVELEAVQLSRLSPPIAVLFTDMVDSTAAAVHLGDDQAQTLIDAHDRTVHAALDSFGGQQVKHTGDGVLARFPSVSAALRASVAIQLGVGAERVSAAVPLHVRIGVNAGEPLLAHDDLFGVTVNLAARACQAAAPDQVLVTGVVRELAVGKGFDFEPAGEFPLKGFPEPVPLWSLVPRSSTPTLSPR